MATHGRGPLGRVLRGSVADRIAREASVATLLVRGEGHAVAPPVMRLVVPLDGSQFAASALPVAATLAGDLGLPIHLVRVVERPMVWNPFTAGARFEEADQRRMKPGAEEAAEEFVFHTTRLGDPVIVATHEVRSGEPIPELLAVLRPGDLIVMSSHGCGGVRRLFLGSVASALVREADAPVLLVRADSAAEPDPFGTSESVQGETSAS